MIAHRRYLEPSPFAADGDQLTVTVQSDLEQQAGRMRHILQAEIEELLPPRALQVARAAERSERGHLLTLANVASSSE